MNSTSIKDKLSDNGGKLRHKFEYLDDLLYQKVKEEDLLGRLQNKLGKTKVKLFKIISKL
jgi:hypothetical protein